MKSDVTESRKTRRAGRVHAVGEANVGPGGTGEEVVVEVEVGVDEQG
jgi:hypothetical protein